MIRKYLIKISTDYISFEICDFSDHDLKNVITGLFLYHKTVIRAQLKETVLCVNKMKLSLLFRVS